MDAIFLTSVYVLLCDALHYAHGVVHARAPRAAAKLTLVGLVAASRRNEKGVAAPRLVVVVNP